MSYDEVLMSTNADEIQIEMAPEMCLPIITNYFFCEICGENFLSKNELRKHKTTHKAPKIFSCNMCLKIFTKKYNLQQHLLSHTGERPHICQICNKGFTRKKYLVEHYLVHTGEEPFVCADCNEGFITEEELKDHEMLHTGGYFGNLVYQLQLSLLATRQPSEKFLL
ncbi:hypothetical protein CEXT_192101 [Caerostris extrusa]|uniref:C2H2-type domain-containing protein n=1 Tax=Caerostris extrusa TaxID=172846 RepID=A0AAV4SWR4_CAEEX|nr:hypothetical protein CEXT_192101 [Caerostris extrusa]